MLNTITSGYLDNPTGDNAGNVNFVPISINYEKTMESGLYSR
jgi:glycerol-3-phosphate O-acyltransferase